MNVLLTLTCFYLDFYVVNVSVLILPLPLLDLRDLRRLYQALGEFACLYLHLRDLSVLGNTGIDLRDVDCALP